VWKVVARNGDVYIISRMMGSQAKVSLHQSGQGQWSLTSAWAEARAIPPQKRHIDRWVVSQPTSIQAAHVFRLIFPSGELKDVGTPRKTISIHWLDPPAPGYTVIVEFYLAPAPPESIRPSQVPFPIIGILPVGATGSLVLLRNQEPLDSAKSEILESVRSQIMDFSRSAGVRPAPHLRAVAFVVADDGARGFIEIAPYTAAA
jgi:hypothetical protein